MATKDRREREKEDLKRKILVAAQQIITTEGFAALSMRKLANRIEYSAAAIYLHFRSREHIAQELSKIGFERFLAQMSAAAEEPDVVARFHALGAAYISFRLENPETYRLIFLGDSGFMAIAFADETSSDAANKSFALLLNLGKDLQSAGLYHGAATHVQIAEMAWAALHGIVSLKLACPGFEFPAETVGPLMTSTLTSGLLAAPPTRKRTTIPRARKAPSKKVKNC